MLAEKPRPVHARQIARREMGGNNDDAFHSKRSEMGSPSRSSDIRDLNAVPEGVEIPDGCGVSVACRLRHVRPRDAVRGADT
jgi:hypothetical protein